MTLNQAKTGSDYRALMRLTVPIIIQNLLSALSRFWMIIGTVSLISAR